MAKRSLKSVLLLLPLIILRVTSDPEASTAPMEKAEQEALYLVIQGFVGKWWNGSELYPDPCGWTQIQGVSCDLFDGLWYVSGMSIGPFLENSLECADDAEFSPLLFELKHLRTLSFFDCFTSHRRTSMPPISWEKLAASLEILEFRSNPGLVGGIPDSLAELRNLQSLVLVENSLSGPLPPGLGKLVHLKRLVLAGNRFSGEIPGSLGSNLGELLILDLGRNALNGSLPRVGGLTSLLKLDVSNNSLHGSFPPELERLSSLTLLDLRGNNLSGPLPRSLQGMTSLRDLLLSNNPLGGSLSEFDWGTLPNLTTLDLSRAGLTGAVPDSIASLRSLRFLALDNNHLTGSIPSKISALPSLTSLYINGNNLTGQLEFSQEFYQRMGRRFASWNNPNLCYSAPVGVAAGGGVPYGVLQCKGQQLTSNYDSGSKDNVYDGNRDQSSSLLASMGFPASPITGLWCGIVVQGMVILFLLAMLL